MTIDKDKLLPPVIAVAIVSFILLVLFKLPLFVPLLLTAIAVVVQVLRSQEITLGKTPALSSFTAKLPWTAIGIIVVVAVVIVVAVKFWPSSWSSGDTFQPKNGMQGWEGNGVTAKFSCYEFSPNGKMTKVFDYNGIDVKLFGVSSETEGHFIVRIKDLEGWGRSATFRYLIKDNKISFEEASYFEKDPESFSLGPTDGVISNYVMSSVDKKKFFFAIGDTKKTVTYGSPLLPKGQQRDMLISYEVTIENQLSSPLRIERIRIV